MIDGSVNSRCVKSDMRHARCIHADDCLLGAHSAEKGQTRKISDFSASVFDMLHVFNTLRHSKPTTCRARSNTFRIRSVSISCVFAPNSSDVAVNTIKISLFSE